MTKKNKFLLVSIIVISLMLILKVSYSYKYIVSSYNYKITNNVIYAVPTSFEFKVGELLDNINYTGEATVYNSDKEQLNTNDIVGTGCTLVVSDVSYDIVVLGDVTGDGLIEIGDVSKLYNHYRGNKTFDGEYLKAGKLTENTDITIGDISKLYNFYRGKKPFNYYSYNIYSMLQSKEFNVKLIKDNEINISNAYIKYNSVLVPMDEVLSNMLDNYNLNNNQEYTYSDKKFKIDLENNNIVFEDVKKVEYTVYYSGVPSNTKTVLDNSIYVDIEEINGINYIPVYFLAYFDNVGITIDNNSVYSGEKYLRAIDSIDINTDKSNLVIDLNYEGDSFDELWKEEAYKRIEKNRKEEVKVVVKDKDGNLLKNSNVELTMLSNDFKFGTAIGYSLKNNRNADDKITNDYFNTVGSRNGFKWSYILGENQSYDTKPIARQTTNFALEHNMYLRGHVLWSDQKSNSLLRDFVGSLDDLKEGTMAYIYNQYQSGSIALDEVNSMVDNLINKFENIVLTHVEEEVSSYPEVQEWDVTNETTTSQYFKYYLYDRKFLEDESFLTSNKYHPHGNNTVNNEYEKFIAKLYDKAKSVNPKARLVLNEDVRGGSILASVARIRTYTNNLDAYGVQYHVNNVHVRTPQTYYNEINKIVKNTGVKNIVVTEYDDYIDIPKYSYTQEENEIRAKYLGDSLVSIYSNKNIDEFVFWVYYDGTFNDLQRRTYESTVYSWLHDKKIGLTNENGEYQENLHKGKYKIKVRKKDKIVEQEIDIKDNMNSIEIII